MGDSCGCVIQGKIDKIPKQITVSIITSLDISFFSSTELLDIDVRTMCYQISGAYYPVCFVTESQRDALFVYTE